MTKEEKSTMMSFVVTLVFVLCMFGVIVISDWIWTE